MIALADVQSFCATASAATTSAILFNAVQDITARMGTVEDIAALVAFLASDEAGFISGAEYAIDGASTAGMTGV